MSRGNETAAQGIIESDMRPGEKLLIMLWATIPNLDSGRGYYIFAPVVPLVRVLNRRRQARAAGRAAGLRLSPAMVIAVTSQRVLFFAARRGWRPGVRCGELPRDRVTGIMTGRSALVGHPPRGLRYIQVCLSGGPDLSLRVAAESARWLRDEFGTAEPSR